MKACPIFGLEAPSICVEYHRRLAVALMSSLEDPSARISNVTPQSSHQAKCSSYRSLWYISHHQRRHQPTH